jgi:hypothetical protein
LSAAEKTSERTQQAQAGRSIAISSLHHKKDFLHKQLTNFFFLRVHIFLYFFASYPIASFSPEFKALILEVRPLDTWWI